MDTIQAKDLKLILPTFFDDRERNRKFAKSKQMDEMITRLEDVIKDKDYDSFLQRNEVTCPLKGKR